MDNASANNTLVNSDDRTFAILSHIGGLFTCWLAPLIIYLIKKSEPGSAFAAEQAKEALNFQITLVLVFIACFVLSFVLIGILFFWVAFIADMVLCIVAAVKVSNGTPYRYPLNLRLIK